jgi:hypothetical protein
MRCTLRSHTRFLALALQALPLPFAFGHVAAPKRLLVHQSQNLPRLRLHRQHTLEQIAVMTVIANGTQSLCLGMLLIVHLRSILNQQNPLVLARGLAALLQMGSHQLLIVHIWALQHAIGPVQSRFALHLLGQ